LNDIDVILVVEDEPSIREVVGLYLKRAGYQVIEAKDGEEALDVLDSQEIALVVLDLMLPKIDGLELTRYLQEFSDVPIIMLTARRSESDRIAGLEMGADDYVVKPFSPQELVSRVRAVLRRTRKSAIVEQEEPIQYSELTLDPATRLVTVQGETKDLTAREFDLLWFLARHPQQVFTRDLLLEHVWGMTSYIDSSTVTVLIRRLREKIETNPSKPKHILTVWGVGYKFMP
jgi:DNA-binding response OmpR family regulator